MEDVYTTEGKITPTTKFSTTETTGSKLSMLSITSRISQLGQHLYILQTSHPHSDPTTEERSFLQWHVDFKECTKRSLLPFLADTLSWLTTTAMTKEVRDIKKKVNQLIETQTQQQETCHLNIKCHQICHVSQQTTHQCSHGSSWEDAQWCHPTLQHHEFNIHPHKLSAGTPTCLLHSGLISGILCTISDRQPCMQWNTQM